MSVLASAILGPLFVPTDMDAILGDRAFIAAMLRTEAALARAEARLGLVPDGLAAAIEAIDPAVFDLDALGRGTAEQGVPAIPFVKALQTLLPPALEPHVHKGATSQDIVDTARVLQIRAALTMIEAGLVQTIDRLADLARAHRETPQIGRTYGQHAVPVTFGFTAATWLAGLLECAEQLPVVRARVLRVSLGGPAGTLHGLGDQGPAVLHAMAAELDLAADPIAWHTRRARLVELGAWLAAVLGAQAKMADDVVRLAATDVGEVGDAASGGSSAMPHKQNPVRATAILAAADAGKALLLPLLDGMVAAHQRPAGAWQAEWLALPPLLALTAGALRPLAILADPARMAVNIDQTRGLVYAERVAALLAPALGRGAAHTALEAAAVSVRDTGHHLRDVLARASLPVPPDALDACFDVAPFVAAAVPWVDRVLTDAARIRRLLSS